MLFTTYCQMRRISLPNASKNLYVTACIFRQFWAITTAWLRTSVVGLYRLQLFQLWNYFAAVLWRHLAKSIKRLILTRFLYAFLTAAFRTRRLLAVQICFYSSFWATVCETVRPMVSDRCLSVCPVLSVSNVGVLWPNGLTDQDEPWHAGRPRPWPHCVRWRKALLVCSSSS